MTVWRNFLKKSGSYKKDRYRQPMADYIGCLLFYGKIYKNPGYPIEPRGIYYAARRLTAQLKRIDKDTNYGSLQKVYSIWLCMGNVPVYEENTVSLYSLNKNDIIGITKRNK